MHLTYKGAQSSLKLLPGGCPQGAYLGGLIFIIKYNGAFLRPSIPRPVPESIASSKVCAVKFVDDGTVAVSVKLKTSLVPDPSGRPRPLNYHERTEHVLPAENNLLQYLVHDTEHFAKANQMVINKEKTKIISFTKSRKLDFPPELEFLDGTKIETMSETRLLGVIISNNLKWHKNTSHICNKARQRLWILRRLNKFNLSKQELYDVYIKEIRSILELAVPVWHSSLTKKETKSIESVQKLAFKIILQKDYITYQQACKHFSALSLAERRDKLSLQFAKTNLKSENNLFTKLTNNVNTRNTHNIVKEPFCNTTRYKKSSIPYHARILNQMGNK